MPENSVQQILNLGRRVISGRERDLREIHGNRLDLSNGRDHVVKRKDSVFERLGPGPTVEHAASALERLGPGPSKKTSRRRKRKGKRAKKVVGPYCYYLLVTWNLFHLETKIQEHWSTG